MELPGRTTLQAAQCEAGLTLVELWLRYLGLGGAASLPELDGYLHGALLMDAFQHDLIALAINECFLELGVSTNIQYWGPPSAQY